MLGAISGTTGLVLSFSISNESDSPKGSLDAAKPDGAELDGERRGVWRVWLQAR